MIKFFRNIRKKLLDQGNTVKYLKYAIGEIVLVVIGILIALQINNWNENQKSKQKEQIYLSKLLINLQDDIGFLNNIIAEDSLIIKSLNKTSKQILSANSINKVLFNNARFKHLQFTPNKTMFENLVSSGNLDIISNEELVERLFLYYREIESIKNGIDNSLKTYSQNIEEFYLSFDHVRNHPKLNKLTIDDYRNNPFILNSMYYKNGLLIMQIHNYKKLSEEAVRLVELTKQEINN